MKPEKALEKLCPWAMAKEPRYAHCVAGNCMAWEWINENETIGFCILIEGKDNAL